MPDYSKAVLQKVNRGRVSLDSVIYSNGWRGYDGLIDLSYAKHVRVKHGQEEFATDRSHINGIKSFWAYAKTRLSRSHGVADATFALHLKECEFRFNHRDQNLYLTLLKLGR